MTVAVLTKGQQAFVNDALSMLCHSLRDDAIFPRTSSRDGVLSSPLSPPAALQTALPPRAHSRWKWRLSRPAGTHAASLAAFAMHKRVVALQKRGIGVETVTICRSSECNFPMSSEEYTFGEWQRSHSDATKHTFPKLLPVPSPAAMLRCTCARHWRLGSACEGPSRAKAACRGPAPSCLRWTRCARHCSRLLCSLSSSALFEGGCTRRPSDPRVGTHGPRPSGGGRRGRRRSAKASGGLW